MAAPDPGYSDTLGRDSFILLTSIPFQLILGTLLGFLSGIGVGGGSLLMLWLTIVSGLSHADARCINLLFFIPAALAACCFHIKQRAVHMKTILPAIFAGCVSSGICFWVSSSLDTQTLKRLFGVLLVVTGLRELMYKEKKAS